MNSNVFSENMLFYFNLAFLYSIKTRVINFKLEVNSKSGLSIVLELGSNQNSIGS